MYIAIAVTAVVCFAGGVFVGRKYEQKAVAKVLAEFAKLDQEAHGLVSRVYINLASGIKAELNKLQRLF